jgi:ribA/ribD-fused uncharacterized protein
VEDKMSISRPSMTSKLVQGYKINSDQTGLVWYPFTDDATDSVNTIFSNYYPKSLVTNYLQHKITYKTPAHYYQALKIPAHVNVVQHLTIARAETPAKAKELAKQYVQERKLVEDEKSSYNNMLQVVQARAQDEEFKNALIATRKGYLYKDTYKSDKPIDTWGGGKDGLGQNLLGKALMTFRQELLNQIEEKDTSVEVLFDQAKIARESLKGTQPSAVAFHTYATAITAKNEDKTHHADTSQLSVTPPVAPVVPAKSRTTATTSPTQIKTSTPVSEQMLNQILARLNSSQGSTWEYSPIPESIDLPAHHHFKNNNNYSFQVYDDKLVTTDPRTESLKAVLEAFLLLNPGKTPSITVGSKKLKKDWLEVCAERHIFPAIKLAEDAESTEDKNADETVQQPAASPSSSTSTYNDQTQSPTLFGPKSATIANKVNAAPVAAAHTTRSPSLTAGGSQ